MSESSALKRDLSVVGMMALCMGLSLFLGACPSDEDPAKNNTTKPNNTNKCVNLCVSSDRKCLNETTILTCVQDEEGCFDFGNPSTCPADRVCRQGMCQMPGDEECSDLCQPGTYACTGAGESQECADFNNDGCFEYGTPTACEGEDVCNQATGQCGPATCQDACTNGESRCEGELISSCRMGPDGCLIYGPGKDCPESKVCMAGDCVERINCEDECIKDEKLCGPDGTPRVCQDTNNDGCVEFAPAAACGNGTECRSGECVSTSACQDQCAMGQRACDGNQIKTCTDTDNDGCVEFDTPKDCPGAGETCDQSGAMATCKVPPVTGKVVINEVFYDALSADVDAQGRASTFIELKGPAGLSLANFEVRLVNGANGMPYKSVMLPTDAKLDGKGFAVLTLDKPDNYLNFVRSNVYSLLTPYANNEDGLQNGPDNVELYDGAGAKVDALGYGVFSGAMVFSGEGMPAEDVYRGRSLGRRPGAADTDNNANDFISYFPTPGQENADLVINEVYFDQPGADGVTDQIETFVELAAPIQGWVDLELEGYTLRAFNGANDMDYIFTGQLNGIVLSPSTPHATIGLNGMVVICNIGVAPALLNKCQIAYDGVDFQNGPDSFVLEYRGRVVDAVGYGTFGAGNVFRGEGSARDFGRANSGKSLSRWPINDPSRVRDTDNNSVDFHLTDPTPGQGNQLPSP